MKIVVLCIFLLSFAGHAANIKLEHNISCISNDSTVKGQHQKFAARKNSEKAKSWFSEWLYAENFGTIKSKLNFIWTPITEKGADIEIITNEKSHNLLKIRSQTRHSLIFNTSASSPFTTESWSFALNFQIESLIATRVQSNIGGLKAEIITYDCRFEEIEPPESSTVKALS